VLIIKSTPKYVTFFSAAKNNIPIFFKKKTTSHKPVASFPTSLRLKEPHAPPGPLELPERLYPSEKNPSSAQQRPPGASYDGLYFDHSQIMIGLVVVTSSSRTLGEKPGLLS
jgi:hypothetical protein